MSRTDDFIEPLGEHINKELDMSSQEKQDISMLRSRIVANDIQGLATILSTPGKQYIKAVDFFGNTLIHKAIALQTPEIFDLLLEIEDAPINVKNKEGLTPLFFAIKRRERDFAEKLIIGGADLQVTADLGKKTVLDYAIIYYMPSVIKLLINRGVDVNAHGDNNTFIPTPLMRLCMFATYGKRWDKTREEILHMLLQRGANIFIKDAKDRTVFDIAARNHRNNAVTILFPHIIKNGKITIFISTLSHIMSMKSPILPELFDYVEKVVYDKSLLYRLFPIRQYSFFELFGWYDNDHLRMFAEKFEFILTDFMQNHSFWNFFFVERRRESFAGLADNLLTLLHMPGISAKLVENLNEKGRCFLAFIIVHPNISYKKMTKIIDRLLELGANFVSYYDMDELYFKYGRCELFDKLLHMNIVDVYRDTRLMPRLIYDPHMTIKRFLDASSLFHLESLDSVFEFFADSALQQYFLNNVEATDSAWYERAQAKLEKLPTVPSLLQLARDSTRQFLVSDYFIESYFELEHVLECLQLPNSIRDMILLKTKLY